MNIEQAIDITVQERLERHYETEGEQATPDFYRIALELDHLEALSDGMVGQLGWVHVRGNHNPRLRAACRGGSESLRDRRGMDRRNKDGSVQCQQLPQLAGVLRFQRR